MEPTLEDHQDKEALPDVMKVKVKLTKYDYLSTDYLLRISDDLVEPSGLI